MEIKDLVNGDYTNDGFLKYGELNVARVRVMGTVVAKFVSEDRNYGFLVLDDSTETIRIRGFDDNLGLVKKAEVGDLIDVIGRLRIYNDEIYIIPEIITKINDPNWWILRKLEIMKQKKILGETGETKEEKVEEKLPEGQTMLESPKEKILRLLKQLDKGEGVELETLIKESYLNRDVVENILNDLLNDGEIFEPRPGKLKLL